MSNEFKKLLDNYHALIDVNNNLIKENKKLKLIKRHLIMGNFDKIGLTLYFGAFVISLGKIDESCSIKELIDKFEEGIDSLIGTENNFYDERDLYEINLKENIINVINSGKGSILPSLYVRDFVKKWVEELKEEESKYLNRMKKE